MAEHPSDLIATAVLKRSNDPELHKAEQKKFAREQEAAWVKEGPIAGSSAPFKHLEAPEFTVRVRDCVDQTHVELVDSQWGNGTTENVGRLDAALSSVFGGWVFELLKSDTQQLQGMFISMPHQVNFRSQEEKGGKFSQQRLETKLDTYMVVQKDVRKTNQGMRLWASSVKQMHELGVHFTYGFLREPRSICAVPVSVWFRILQVERAHRSGYQVDCAVSRGSIEALPADQFRRAVLRLTLRNKVADEVTKNSAQCRPTIFSDWALAAAKNQKRICLDPSEQQWNERFDKAPFYWRTILSSKGKLLAMFAYRPHQVYIPTVGQVAKSAQLCFFEAFGHHEYATLAMRVLIKELSAEGAYVALHGVSMGDFCMVEEEAKCLVYATTYLDFYNLRLNTKQLQAKDFSLMYV